MRRCGVELEQDAPSLTAAERKLLQYLRLNHGITLTRTQLLRHLWDVDGDFVDATPSPSHCTICGKGGSWRQKAHCDGEGSGLSMERLSAFSNRCVRWLLALALLCALGAVGMDGFLAKRQSEALAAQTVCREAASAQTLLDAGVDEAVIAQAFCAPVEGDTAGGRSAPCARYGLREVHRRGLPAELCTLDIASGLRLARAVDSGSLFGVGASFSHGAQAARDPFPCCGRNGQDFRGHARAKGRPIDVRRAISETLLDALNRLSARIQYLLATLREEKSRLKDLMQDISHQLKTPLAVLRLNHDLLSALPVNADQQRFLSADAEQLDKMEWLIHNQLKLARLDAGVVIYEKQSVPLRATLEESLSGFSALLQKRGIQVCNDVPPKLCIRQDPAWLGEAFSNLLRNAISHTQDGTLSLGAEETPLSVRLWMRDTGEGISNLR